MSHFANPVTCVVYSNDLTPILYCYMISLILSMCWSSVHDIRPYKYINICTSCLSIVIWYYSIIVHVMKGTWTYSKAYKSHMFNQKC